MLKEYYRHPALYKSILVQKKICHTSGGSLPVRIMPACCPPPLSDSFNLNVKEGRSVGRVERPSGNLNSSDDLFGKTWAGPTVRGAWLDEEEARCWMGRESQNERASEMGGAEDRLLLRTARRGGWTEGRPTSSRLRRERDGRTLELAELSRRDSLFLLVFQELTNIIHQTQLGYPEF